MLYRLMDALCRRIDKCGDARGRLRKTFLFAIYKWIRATPMFFDYRMVNLYSRKAFRDCLDDKECSNWISLWIQSYQKKPEDFSWPLELNDPVPWINFKAIWFMELFLSCRKEPIVFEYGSGASTIWFSKRCKKVISVEDDKDWASKMSEILKKRDINNVDYNFVPSQLDDNKISQYQSFFYKNVHFENYVKTMLKYSNNFDLIFIDGRARPAAIELAHSKVNDGGIIVLDNSDRPRYSQAIQYLLKNQWKVLKTSGPVSYGEGMGETTIFYEKRLL